MYIYLLSFFVVSYIPKTLCSLCADGFAGFFYHSDDNTIRYNKKQAEYNTVHGLLKIFHKAMQRNWELLM